MDPEELFPTLSTASNRRGAFSFIFLSLMLVILCFFIKIISISDFEQIKIDAVTTSVQSAFQSARSRITFFHPSFMPSGPVVMSQELFQHAFEDAAVQQSWDGQMLFVSLPEEALFQPFQDTLTPEAKHFFKNLAHFLQTHHPDSYEIGFTHLIDLPTDGSYPVYSHLAARRAQKTADYWISSGIPAQTIHVGFQKGATGTVSVFLNFNKAEEKNANHLPQ